MAGPLAFGDIEQGSSNFYLHLTEGPAKALYLIEIKAINKDQKKSVELAISKTSI